MSESRAEVLQLKHVRKSFGKKTKLKDINVDIRQGEVVALIGPTSAGKSVLLRSILMIDPPDSGEIWLNGQCITENGTALKSIRRQIGLVFSNFNLFNHYSVLENVMRPQVDLLHLSRQEAYDRSEALLRRVGMVKKMDALPDSLTSSQKQRVAIARTVAMNPDIILFDEPTSMLDPTFVGEVEAVIRDLAKDGTTMLIATNELRFAQQISSRVLFLDKGIIYEEGNTKDFFSKPRQERTARFLRQCRVLELELDDMGYDFNEASRRIEQYCFTSGMCRRDMLRVSAVFEEMIEGILQPHLGTPFRISAAFEYLEDKNKLLISLLYPGDEFDPKTTTNQVSYSIVEKMAAEIRYNHSKVEGYTNQLRLVVMIDGES